MRIRILHVVNSLRKGGLENGLVNLVEHMDAERFEHVICTMRGLGLNAERLHAGHARVLALGSEHSRSRFQTPSLVGAIRRLQPDVVHSRNWGAIESVLAARIARGCVTVHSEHGYEAEASTPELGRRTLFRRVAYELADQVVTVSDQIRQQQASRTGFKAERMAVVHNGVDPRRFSPNVNRRAQTREEFGIGPSEFCIGCVANLLPVKDHLTLLRALQPVSDAVPEWRVLLIGDGPERSRLDAFLASHPGWMERVSFLGISDRVPDILRALDVFVLPSVAEGICNALLEAMATGLAVLATAVGGNPEVVVDGESGLLFPAANAGVLGAHLLRLAQAPAQRARLGQEALVRVREKFSLDSMVQAYEQLYVGLLPATRAQAALAR